jgi:hypothetical protein
VFGLPTGLGEHARLAHEPPRPLLQAPILAEGHDVLDALGLQDPQHVVASKAAIQADPQAGAGKGGSQLLKQAAEPIDRAELGRAGARAQQRQDQVLLGLVVEGHEPEQGQVAPGVVVAVEERELLLAMGGVVRRIEIDRDAPGAAAKGGAVLPDHEVCQRVPQPGQRQRAKRILEPRQRRLRRQGGTGERIAIEQEFVDRVVGQPGGVVAIRIAADQPENALAYQVDQLVLDFARLPAIPQAARHRIGHPELPIDGLEQDRTPIGTGVGDVELHDHIRLEREADLRYTVCSHRASVLSCAKVLRHHCSRTLDGLDGSSLSSFANFPGLEVLRTSTDDCAWGAPAGVGVRGQRLSMGVVSR